MKQNLLLLSFILICTFGQSQSNYLDQSFGQGGIVVGNASANNWQGRCIAVQPDQRIVAGGHELGNYALIRRNTDGSADTSFNHTGIVIESIGQSGTWRDITVQNDGKILVTGECYFNAFADFAIVRYNSNGTKDSTFGLNGSVILDFGNQTEDRPTGIKIQNDGKIIVAGYGAGGNPYPQAIIVRLNPDGSLDTSFNSNGKLILNTGPPGCWIFALAVDNSDRAYIGGTQLNSQNNNDFLLARLNSNGSLDSSFSNDGIVIEDIGGNSEDGLYALTLQPNGKILVTGYEYEQPPNAEDQVVMRYNFNGTIDTTFGTGGRTIIDFGANRRDFSRGIAVLPTGKITIAGWSNYGLNWGELTLARLNSNGTPDFSFNSTGKILVQIASGISCFGMAAQNDGKIVTIGLVDTNSVVTGCLARFDLESITSLPEYIKDKLIFYPNPINGSSFTLESEKIASELSVYDCNSKCVFQKRDIASRKVNLDFSDFARGVYILEVKTGETKLYQKLIVN